MGILSRAAKTKAPPGTQALREEIAGFWRAGSSYQGIILERPENAGDAEGESFIARASSLAASFGRCFRLPSGDALVLFPPGSDSLPRDRELITHRLAQTLRTRALAGFHAESPEEALSCVQGARRP
jgi:hypothetical protein